MFPPDISDIDEKMVYCQQIHLAKGTLIGDEGITPIVIILVVDYEGETIPIGLQRDGEIVKYISDGNFGNVLQKGLADGTL